MSANRDMRGAKEAELRHTRCLFVLSLCGFYLDLACRKRVSVEKIRFDCLKRGGSGACVAAVELFEVATLSGLKKK